MATAELQTRLRETFERWMRQGNHHRWSPHHPLRRNAFEVFERLGFPTTRHEDWKYTSLAPALRPAYRIELPPPPDISTLPSRLEALEGLPTPQLWLLNGIPIPTTLPASVHFRNLLQGEEANPPLGDILPSETDAFIALNTAFTPDVALLTLAGHLGELLHIAVVTTADDEPQLAHPRLRVQLEAGAQLRVLLSFHTLGTLPSFTNTVTEISLGPAAQLELILWQTDPSAAFAVTTLGIELADHARLSLWTLALGGSLLRDNLYIRLSGPGAAAQLFGATMVSGQRTIDHRTYVEHRAEQCTSNQLYKSAAEEHGTVTFTGRIHVRPHAQKTNAYQSHRAIPLAETATVNARPQLEIYADDVRCTHGATVGALDEKALFYLRARGIPHPRARALLLHAFLREALALLPDENLRRRSDTLLAERVHLPAAEVL